MSLATALSIAEVGGQDTHQSIVLGIACVAGNSAHGDSILEHVDEGYYTNDSTFIMTGNDLKYLLAVLNSEVSEWYFDFIAPTSGMGTTMWKKAYIEQIPIAETSDSNKKTVECLVDYIIFERKHNGESNAFVFFDDLLNSIVFELYFPEEIKKADCEILKRLQDLPDLKSIQDTDSKLSTVRKVYDNLSNPAHPVSIAMNKIKGVPEVMAIGS